MDAVLRSYTQLFFSLDKKFGIALLLGSFLDFRLGLAGLLSVIFSNFMAFLGQLSTKSFAQGLYGYNALLTGVALAFDWSNGLYFLPVLFLASSVSLVMTIFFNSILERWNLPSLSIPFVITIWILTLFLRSSNILLPVNHMIHPILPDLTYVLDLDNSLRSSLPAMIRILLSTFSGIFFIDSPLAGLLIAGGILLWSRIALVFTSLVLISSYYLFSAVLGPGAWMNYQCGSNFIFLALSVGCFYAVPSPGSLIASLFLLPFTLLFHVFFGNIGQLFTLPVYTLAFTGSVHLFLTLMRQWGLARWIVPIELQQYSPESAVYRTSFFAQRLKNIGKIQFRLPFLGEWMVSQGYDGKFTHKGEWSSALDFIILDTEMKGFQRLGKEVEDYYCFNKPVLAPADGYILEIINHIDENPISGMDIKQNWGNSVVIHHADGLCSQLSHLKKDSINVVVGQYVKAGEILANCGNSGRSPEPHLHFQFQRDGKLGSKTFPYPIAYYITKKQNRLLLNEFSIPQEGELISNVEQSPSLVAAFNMLPGNKWYFSDEQDKKVEWEVFTDSWNRCYIYCHNSGAYAYFVNDGTMFYFTDFDGNKDSLLYVFYLAAYKVLLGTYPNLSLEDWYSMHYVSHPIARIIQDFVAPFLSLASAKFVINYPPIATNLESKSIQLSSQMELRLWRRILSYKNFTIQVEGGKIASIGMDDGVNQKVWRRID